MYEIGCFINSPNVIDILAVPKACPSFSTFLYVFIFAFLLIEINSLEVICILYIKNVKKNTIPFLVVISNNLIAIQAVRNRKNTKKKLANTPLTMNSWKWKLNNWHIDNKRQNLKFLSNQLDWKLSNSKLMPSRPNLIFWPSSFLNFV